MANDTQTLKVECDSIQHNKQQLSVRFIIPVAPVKPGTPATMAKTIVQLTFSDKKEASDFVPGKEYVISITPAKK